MVEFGDGGALNKDLSLLYPSSKSRCANIGVPSAFFLWHRASVPPTGVCPLMKETV